MSEDDALAFVTDLLAGHGESEWLSSKQLLRNTIESNAAWVIESEFVDFISKFTGQFEKVAWAVWAIAASTDGESFHRGTDNRCMLDVSSICRRLFHRCVE